MVYRNWKQELTDERSAESSRRPVIVTGVVVAVMVAACCAMWIWPGFLREDTFVEKPETAEQLYLETTQPAQGERP